MIIEGSSLTVLVAIDAIIYALLVLAIYRWRMISRQPSVANLAEAFRVLEVALEKSLLDLPQGFTWKAAVKKAKERNYRVKWPEIESALAQYEAYRYGGLSLVSGDSREVLKLAGSLGKGAKFASKH